MPLDRSSLLRPTPSRWVTNQGDEVALGMHLSNALQALIPISYDTVHSFKKMARALHRLPVLALGLVALCLFSTGNNAAAAEKMVGVYGLTKGDFSVKVTNWGATLMSAILPDSKGTFVFHDISVCVCVCFLSKIIGNC
jgi:hypothetical protein